MFNRFGITNVTMVHGEILDKRGMDFIEVQTKKSGLVADAHILALSTTKPPFLILEDDVMETKNHTIFEIPDDADCLYLGSSIWGMSNGKSVQYGTKTSPHSEKYCLVRDMLGIHAVLYLTPTYVSDTIEMLKECKEKNQFCDECVAMNMENHRVYCVREPVFFQNDGLNERVTLFPLKDYHK